MEDWKPKTELGRDVLQGKIKTIDEIFRHGYKIKEPEVVDALLPNLGKEIIFIGGSPGKGGGIRRTSTRRTARMHRSGRRFTISACVVVGSPGYIGLGKSSGLEHTVAIDKATQQAKLNLIPIKRGCGSWECGCKEKHSIPIKIGGKSGALKIELHPAPKGIGLCIGEEMKKILKLAGIEDLWSKVFGDSRTRFSYALAVFDTFKNLNKIKIDSNKACEQDDNSNELAENGSKEPKTTEEITEEIINDGV